MNAEDDFDYWTEEAPAPEKPAESPLLIEIIDGVEPLDDQFGVAVPKTVPDALYEALFGQPEPTKDELANSKGDSAKVPPLHTYAILDAAKVTNLPEMLDTSGLDHRCLFKGKAEDELKSVAPWLVRLQDGNTFNRNMFTLSTTPWHLWGSEPGIYLRSRGTLDDVWKHFRKLTKVQDENQKWYYFRYWERQVLANLGSGLFDDLANAMFFSRGVEIKGIFVIDITASKVLQYQPCHTTFATNAVPRLSTAFLGALDTATSHRKCREEITALRRTAPFQNDQSIDDQQLVDLRNWLFSKGFKQTEQRLVAMQLYLQAYFNNRVTLATEILSDTASGAGIRLWKLQKMFELK